MKGKILGGYRYVVGEGELLKNKVALTIEEVRLNKVGLTCSVLKLDEEKLPDILENLVGRTFCIDTNYSSKYKCNFVNGFYEVKE